MRAFITNRFGETCTQPISFADVSTVDVENVPTDARLALMLYPNPAEAYLNVFMNEADTEQTIMVYDLHGKAVLSHKVEGAVTTLPVASLPAGMYIVQVGARVGKFFKE